jgi:SNW domain-containing protein 1
MGTERRIQAMAREQNRDISEKVALGLAKPTQSSESMWDSRLFNQTSGMQAGFNEDNPYDKPLFAAQDAINSIYRPRAQTDVDDEDAGEGEMSKLEKTKRFEVLGRAKEGFRGAAEAEVSFRRLYTSFSLLISYSTGAPRSGSIREGHS